MKDVRLIAAAGALLVALLGYIGLVVTGHTDEAGDLLAYIGLPALTFVIGLGSDIKDDLD